MPIELKSPVLLVSANSAWNILNYRLGLMEALRDAGYRVAVAVPADADSSRLAALGWDVHPLPLDARGTSPWSDGKLFVAYLRLFRRLRPTAFLGFTIKPNIYGALAARFAGVKTVANISGLGTMFVKRTALTRLVIALYRQALVSADVVFFQNRENAAQFLEEGLVRSQQVRLLPGSGIDLDRFRPAPLPADADTPTTFLMVARLLWDKGVREFVEVAGQSQQGIRSVRFQLLGRLEQPGDHAVPESQLRRWEESGVIQFLGSAEDVRPALAAADCVVLPSYYREGVPRALLEAAAMGRPVITTDTPGCRDAVDDGLSGFLCAPRSVESLLTASRRFLELPHSDRERMGAAGRAKMEREFDQSIVHQAYVGALGESR